MKQISIDSLNNHLFEAIEMLKNNSDPNASDNEKMDVETAKTIASLGKVVVEGYKVKANVLNMINSGDNMRTLSKLAQAGGIFSEEDMNIIPKE